MLAVLRWLALACLVSVPFAMAHSAPNPPEEATRLLADWNDDCGGDGGAGQGNCQGGHDLIALDVQEVFDPSAGNVLVFRLFLDKGQDYPITDTLTLTTPSGAKTFSMQTSDDSAFTNLGGFDRIGPGKALGDGNRFTVEGFVSHSSIGMQPGQTFSSFKVESTTNGVVGDFMPGGCNNAAGPCVDTGQSSEQYIAGGGNGNYKLKGSAHYATIAALTATQTVAKGGETVVQLTVKNLLRRTPQEVTVDATGTPGVKVSLGAGEGTRTTLALGPAGTTTLDLRISGVDAGASGTITLTLTTDKGGRAQAVVPYAVTSGSSATGSDSRGSPAIPLTMAASVVLLAVLRRRR